MMIVNLVNCDKSSDIEKAFIDNEIIPDVLKIAPNKILNVRLMKSKMKIIVKRYSTFVR